MSQYEQYVQDNILTASPLELVTSLYRFVVTNVQEAARYTLSGDIEARGRAATRAAEGLSELLTSLDHRAGGELSARLAELYGYMASRVLQGHMEQSNAPFEEVERLMATLLESWDAISQTDSHSFSTPSYMGGSETPIQVDATF